MGNTTKSEQDNLCLALILLCRIIQDYRVEN